MAKAMDAQDRSIVDDIRDGIVDANDFAIDSFCGYHVAPIGHRIARIKSHEVIPPKEIVSNYMGEIRHTGEYSKSYIALTLVTSSGESFETRLYAAFTEYFVNDLDDQVDNALKGYSLSQVLKYFTTHDMEIWVSRDRTYGRKIAYHDPALDEARRLGLYNAKHKN